MERAVKPLTLPITFRVVRSNSVHVTQLLYFQSSGLGLSEYGSGRQAGGITISPTHLQQRGCPFYQASPLAKQLPTFLAQLSMFLGPRSSPFPPVIPHGTNGRVSILQGK